jgi:hypothetical protein
MAATDATNTDFEWLTNGVVGGNSVSGTISRFGLYTAPQGIASTRFIEITVKSKTDPTKTGRAALAVLPDPAPITVSISPSVASLHIGGQQQYTAIIAGTTNHGITWFVNDKEGGDSKVGTISSTGVYTAPQIALNSVIITAKSTYDAAISGSANAIIASPAVTVSSTGVTNSATNQSPIVTQSTVLQSAFTSPTTTWTTQIGAPPRSDYFEHLSGTWFSCDYSKTVDRCYWEAPASLDLSHTTSLVIWIYVTNAQSVGNFILYFRSGSGWYKAYSAFNDGWNRFEVRPSNFAVEGTPAGLSQIDRIMVSPWKRSNGSSEFFVTMGIEPPSIVALSGLGAVFASPAASWQASPPAELAQTTASAKGNGRRFSCDFAQLQSISFRENDTSQTCVWSHGGLELSLSPNGSITGWVNVQNASAIWLMQLRLRSGGSYYSWNINLYEGWNRLELNMRDAVSPPDAYGWNDIDQVQVVLSKLKGERASVSVVAVASNLQTLNPSNVFQWPDADLDLQRQARRDPSGRLIETRAILDESPFYLNVGADHVLDQMSQAGLNVYIPIVWHGKGAIYKSGTVVEDARYSAQLNEPGDPLADLIVKAHARGIQIHAWFTVALRESPIYSQFAPPGTPTGAFDMQDPAFRNFIINSVILDVARRYDIDGINLDYIRTIDTSFTTTARNLYLQKYSVSIDELRNPLSSPAVSQRQLEWQDAAVSNVVQRVSNWIMTNKPWIILSTDGHPLPAPQLNPEGRNDRNWATTGWTDTAYDMDYNRTPNTSVTQFVRQTSQHPERFTKILGNYDRVPDGSGGWTFTPRPGSMLAKQTEYFLRKFPGRAGIALYMFGYLNDNSDQIDALRSGPFQENAIPDSRR